MSAVAVPSYGNISAAQSAAIHALTPLGVLQLPRVIDAALISQASQGSGRRLHATRVSLEILNSIARRVRHYKGWKDLRGAEKYDMMRRQTFEDFSDGPPLTRRARFLVPALLGLLVGSSLCSPIILYMIYRRYATTRRRKLIFWAAILFLVFHTVPPSDSFRHWKPFRRVHQYFHTIAIIEDPESLPPREPLLIGSVPHGIAAISQGILATSGFGQILGRIRYIVATLAFKAIPFGYYNQLTDSVLANAPAISRALKEDKGPLVLNLGGIREMYESDPDREVVVVKPRKGFIKLAMKAGVDIRPMYIFGQTQIYNVSRLSQRLLKPIGRAIGAGIYASWGAFGIPMVPLRRPFLYILGRKLNTGAHQEDPQSSLLRLHSTFVDEIQRMFDTYKPYYGWEDRELTIL